jgi:hypothetical protein
MSRLRLPPQTSGAGKEADWGRGRMALQPARVTSAGTRQSSPLAVLPQLQAVPSTAGAPVTPRRLQAAAARFRDAHSKSGGASTSAFAPSLAHRLSLGSGPRSGSVGAWPCGWSAAEQHSHRSPFPSRGSPAQERPTRVVDREARRPHQALGVEGPARRRAGVSPPQVRRAVHGADHRRHGGAVLPPVRSCSTKRPRRRCTLAWGQGVTWSVSLESS